MSAANYTPRILIVEQNVSVQAAMAFPLHQLGYETATTRHLQEALDVIREDFHEIVVLDPFEGFAMLELLQELRTNEEYGFPHVILVSTSIGRARGAVENGWADVALDKDLVTWEEVAQAVADLLIGN